ncbi:hypothetical protein [Vibrio harveyi]|uniref:hypothetical protein n=1 Tax=Vibrio harveyi TaxID=669 RepID=UPI003BB53A5E|nr:hypothetical protein [Vibrio harveyi]
MNTFNFFEFKGVLSKRWDYGHKNHWLTIRHEDICFFHRFMEDWCSKGGIPVSYFNFDEIPTMELSMVKEAIDKVAKNDTYKDVLEMLPQELRVDDSNNSLVKWEKLLKESKALSDLLYLLDYMASFDYCRDQKAHCALIRNASFYFLPCWAKEILLYSIRVNLHTFEILIFVNMEQPLGYEGWLGQCWDIS